MSDMPPQHRQAEQHSADQFLARVQAVKQAMDRLFLGLGYLAGMLFTALAFFITYDVIARKWGDAIGIPTTRVTDEISGYIMAIAITWGFAYTLRSEGHVRIDVLLPYMSHRLRRWVDFLAMWTTGFLACLFAWKVWVLVVDSWQTGMRSSTYLLTPMWIPQGILGVGFSFLAIAAVLTPVCEYLELVALRRRQARFPGQTSAPRLEGEPPAYGQGDGVSLHPE
jgi:TRAP-type mannitol/chloroaromatic compound transport system permease small subunit